MAGDGQGDPRCQPFCDGRRKGFITGRRIQKNKKGLLLQTLVLTGGAEGNRTPDLLNAIQALSQLSYTPIGESYSNRFRRKMQVFSRENLKITAMTENTGRA